MELLSLAFMSLAAGGTVFLLLDSGAGLADLAVKLDYDFRIKEFRVRGLSLKIVIDFVLKNPTDKELKISHPLIMLYYLQTDAEKNFLAQNTVYNKTYILKPYGNLTVPNLDFSVSITDLVKIVSDSIDAQALSLLKQGKLTELANLISNSVDKLRQNIIYEAYFKVNGIEIKYDDNLSGLGYSPLSAIDRGIEDGSKFDKYFRLPQGKSTTILKDAEVEDTVRQMHKIVEKDAHLIKEFSQLFADKSRYQTAQKIYDWVYRYLKYNLEKGEQLKNPLVSYHLAQRKAREFYAKNGYYKDEYSVDCDDISIFIASILRNLGIPYAFRIAAYSNRGYQHVYVITWDEQGNEIIIDPVYWRFNAEKPYVKEKTMTQLDGIPVEYLYGTDLNTQQSDAGYNLIRTARQAIATDYFGRLKGKGYLLQMYDYLLEYWNTPYREKAIEILAQKERELCSSGKIARHNLFRLLESNGLSGNFWDTASTTALILNPFTAPIGIAKLLYDKNKDKEKTKKAVTPYDNDVQTATNTGRAPAYVAPASDAAINEPKQSFTQKIAKPLIIGGSVITFGTIGFLIYKNAKQTNSKYGTGRHK